jgi:hypothetical protein
MRNRARGNRSHTAGLTCGVVLAYESGEFVPKPGELVPCRRHGHCRVSESSAGGRDRTGASFPSRARRSQGELLEYLRGRPVSTVSALRRLRFSLRLIAEAEKEGMVDVDLVAGTVVLRRLAHGTVASGREPGAGEHLAVRFLRNDGAGCAPTSP